MASQRLSIKSFCCLKAMEIIEAILWSRPDDLVYIENSEVQNCSLRNKHFTLAAWVFILFWQPFFAIYSCRRSGKSENWKLLMVPEKLSVLFGLSILASYIYTISSSQPVLLRRLADSEYRSYMNNNTCTYIGKGGHFHWTLANVDSYLVPNSYTYALLWFSCACARPWRLFSGILLFGLSLFIFFLVQFHGSFEAGSVWCWSAMIMFVYVAIQPYALPVLTNEYDKCKISNGTGVRNSPALLKSANVAQRSIRVSKAYRRCRTSLGL